MQRLLKDLALVSSEPRPGPGPVPVRTMIIELPIPFTGYQLSQYPHFSKRQSPDDKETRDVSENQQQGRATIETLRRLKQQQDEVVRDLKNINAAMVIKVAQLKVNAVQHESDLVQSRSDVNRLRGCRDYYKKHTLSCRVKAWTRKLIPYCSPLSPH